MVVTPDTSRNTSDNTNGSNQNRSDNRNARNNNSSGNANQPVVTPTPKSLGDDLKDIISGAVDVANKGIRFLGWLFIGLTIVAIISWRRGYRIRYSDKDDKREHSSRGQIAVIYDDVWTILNLLKTTVATKDDLKKLKLQPHSGSGSPAGSPGIDDKLPPEVSTHSDATTALSDSSSTQQAGVTEEAEQFVPSTPKEKARALYRELVTSRPRPEQLYLENQGISDAARGFEHDDTKLKRVVVPQATFVLFQEDGEHGWVFPNPVPGYRYDSLKDVFPKLREPDFMNLQSVEPVAVRRVKDDLWKVENS